MYKSSCYLILPAQPVRAACPLVCTMVFRSTTTTTTTTFRDDGNQGLQVGYNSGCIHIAAAGKCPYHSDSPSATHAVSTERRKTSPRPLCFVPFRRDPDFVDRAALLDEILERCSEPASRVALVGLGGVE